MIEVTEAYVKTTAFNQSSFTNAKKLVNSNKIKDTYITKDANLIYGECMGSGKSGYKVSVDFMNPTEPVFRCSCPSRQFPCKHGTALLYQYFLDSSVFEEGDVPEDVASKREKIEKKEKKKKENTGKPKKVNTSAFIKKMKKQVEGLALIENFISECMLNGFASLTMMQINSYRKALIKELGSYYLPDFQGRIEVLLDTLESGRDNSEDSNLAGYQEFTKQMCKLQALVEKSKAVLNECITEKKIVDVQSALAFTRMGYVWKLEELKQLGFYKENCHLIQLGIYDYPDDVKKANIDEALYICLEDGEIYKTQNIRPYKLKTRLKEEDSMFEKVQVPECMIYPGDRNKRIRYEGYTTEPIENEDILKIRETALTDYKEVLKIVKNQLKDGLADENPVMLLHYDELFKAGDNLAIRDGQGETILLGDVSKAGMNSTLTGINFLLEKADLTNQVMLGMFDYLEESGQLIMQPISIVTPSEIKRLLG